MNGLDITLWLLMLAGWLAFTLFAHEEGHKRRRRVIRESSNFKNVVHKEPIDPMLIEHEQPGSDGPGGPAWFERDYRYDYVTETWHHAPFTTRQH